MLYVLLGVAAIVGVSMLTMTDAVAADKDDRPVVVLETTKGTIAIELDPQHAPLTVDNFLKYVDAGFYDNLTFHRVIPGFMIQGGGMDDRMREKADGLRAPIKNEARNGLHNERGTIAMARTNDPDSATSQFFINVADNTKSLDPGGVSPDGYAVFGKVISGMDNVDKIVSVPTVQRGPHGDVPKDPIYIKSAKRKAKS